ncbi:hypothetical protein OKW38_001383 [Paraburkholderia sp. MM5496-R1]
MDKRHEQSAASETIDRYGFLGSQSPKIGDPCCERRNVRGPPDFNMSPQIPRPIDPSLHPLVTGNYGIATPVIEAFYEFVVRCLRYRIMGALIYGPSRIGKPRAIV